jgi:hypothetical protein
MLDEHGALRRYVRRLPPPVLDVVRETAFRAAIRPSDVFLVGHPKSGNTWLAYMLAIALRGGDREGRVTMANLKTVIPWIHGDHPTEVLKSKSLPNPRIFRQHAPTYPDLYPNTIYVVRDPRSVLVSLYHHYLVRSEDQRMTLGAFVDKYMTDDVDAFDWRPVRWDKQVSEWLERASRSSVFMLSYEALHQDRVRVLGRVGEFCGASIPEGAIELAARRGRFEAMRSEEGRVGAEPYLVDFGDDYRATEGNWFVRDGRIDGWKDELPPRARRAIEGEFRPLMDELGYRPLD